jgi:hypothetical protein
MITFAGVVHHHASNLEHQVRVVWRPAHLLLSIHPAMSSHCTALSVPHVVWPLHNR